MQVMPGVHTGPLPQEIRKQSGSNATCWVNRDGVQEYFWGCKYTNGQFPSGGKVRIEYEYGFSDPPASVFVTEASLPYQVTAVSAMKLDQLLVCGKGRSGSTKIDLIHLITPIATHHLLPNQPPQTILQGGGVESIENWYDAKSPAADIPILCFSDKANSNSAYVLFWPTGQLYRIDGQDMSLTLQSNLKDLALQPGANQLLKNLWRDVSRTTTFEVTVQPNDSTGATLDGIFYLMWVDQHTISSGVIVAADSNEDSTIDLVLSFASEDEAWSGLGIPQSHLRQIGE
jgi:hypothetical protein